MGGAPWPVTLSSALLWPLRSLMLRSCTQMPSSHKWGLFLIGLWPSLLAPTTQVWKEKMAVGVGICNFYVLRFPHSWRSFMKLKFYLLSAMNMAHVIHCLTQVSYSIIFHVSPPSKTQAFLSTRVKSMTNWCQVPHKTLVLLGLNRVLVELKNYFTN